MKESPTPSSSKAIWLIAGIIVLVFLLAGAGVFYLLREDEREKGKRRVTTVTLLSPPPMKEKPPPPLREKVPEPEIQKKEALIEEVPSQQTPQPKGEDKPVGESLGIDAEGGAGSDSFGLVAKRGGRDITTIRETTEPKGGGNVQAPIREAPRVAEKPKIGGKESPFALRTKYAWYTQIVQDELRKKVRRHLEENGGIPKGKLEAVVRIVVDERGSIVDFEILDSSGNREMDEAVRESIRTTMISEPPPEGMPRSMRLKISSQG